MNLLKIKNKMIKQLQRFYLVGSQAMTTAI